MIINGQEVESCPGETVLETARRYGFEIPTLCYHKGLGAYGGCRLCLVEVEEGDRSLLAASCTLPARPSLKILTESQPLQRARLHVLALLLARCGPLPVLQELAERYGADEHIYPRLQENDCILCGLCVRACEIVGAKVLSFTWRGSGRKVSTPFGRFSEECFGCQACVNVCPTGAIGVHEERDGFTLIRWKTEHQYAMCRSCGRPFVAYRFAENFGKFLKAHVGGFRGTDHFELCSSCRRSLQAGKMSEVTIKR